MEIFVEIILFLSVILLVGVPIIFLLARFIVAPIFAFWMFILEEFWQ